MQERRKSKRLELESKIIIKSLNDPGEQHETTIDITDVSKTGVGFNCDLPLQIGTVYEAYLTIWTKEVIQLLSSYTMFHLDTMALGVTPALSCSLCGLTDLCLSQYATLPIGFPRRINWLMTGCDTHMKDPPDPQLDLSSR